MTTRFVHKLLQLFLLSIKKDFGGRENGVKEQYAFKFKQKTINREQHLKFPKI